MDINLLKQVLYKAGDVISAKITQDMFEAIAGSCSILGAGNDIKLVANSMVAERLSKRLLESKELTYYGKIGLLDDCIQALENGEIDE